VAVYRVTEGDTVRVSPEIEGEDVARLIGVDAPEANTSGSVSPEPYAEEAKSFTQSNSQDGDVTLEFDAEKRNDYGRLLAYVYSPTARCSTRRSSGRATRK
jgi:micrococcal nuclease